MTIKQCLQLWVANSFSKRKIIMATEADRELQMILTRLKHITQVIPKSNLRLESVPDEQIQHCTMVVMP